jgi:L-ascorbate metabolism protein UlaG (beta-lactamase superfamily)
MKIRHYLYNAFIIEDEVIKIAVDPGKNLSWMKRSSLIPESEWKGISHILVTHGDPDHFSYAAEMAWKTGAEVICGEGLETELISTGILRPHSLQPGETISFRDLKVEGIRTEHGPLELKMLGGMIRLRAESRKSRNVYSHGSIALLFGLIRLEKDNIDFALGSTGFRIFLNGMSLINLGDTLYLDEWTGYNPDILMLPIGGGTIPNTMDVESALRAVDLITPGLVIPCHYNLPYGLKKCINPADDQYFRKEVEKKGLRCEILGYGDELKI